ncbi:MAG: CHASE3 domain-containing protein, partial [Acidobacteriaceae bacterium]|nr:CHASE3 domain-containing protein [Acidobacteriaceae bacterium]
MVTYPPQSDRGVSAGPVGKPAKIQRGTRGTFVLVLLVPVLLFGISVWSAHRYADSIRWVLHTRDVLAQIDAVLLSITSAESSQRGYLLTGDEALLRNYEQVSSTIRSRLEQLRQLTRDNPAQQKNVERLSGEVLARFARLNDVLAFRRPGGLPPSEGVLLMQEGRRRMVKIRNIASEITAEEDRLLSLRRQQERTTRIDVTVCSVMAIFVSMALLYWAYQLMRKYALERDVAEIEIRQLNAELEKRVEERTTELQSANQQLSRSNEDLARFAYLASHDLQEPLRTIASYASLLARRSQGKLDEEGANYLSSITDGAKRMHRLVQDLLEYARAETQALNLRPTDLNPVVDAAMENLQVAISERNAQITRTQLPVVNADGGKLTLVFQNLIGNALKFNKPGIPPCINISAAQHATEWVFTVHDNGIGFDPEHAERIFMIFERLSGSAFPGTGL